jgi:predicted nucleic acid-binding protein
MSVFRKVELDNEIAKIAAEFRRKYGTSLLDSIIAATAYRETCPVLTKNLKDFERIKEVKFESP